MSLKPLQMHTSRSLATPLVPITCRADFPQHPRLLLAAITDEIVARRFSTTRIPIATRQRIAVAPHSANSALANFSLHFYASLKDTPILQAIPPPRSARRREPPKNSDPSDQVVGRFRRF
jgi:hypothetical protein